MSDSRTHAKAALTTSLFFETFLLIKDFNEEKKTDILICLKRLGIAGIFAVIGVLLPDIFEPARNYHHRRFFHSLVLAGLLITFFVLLQKKVIKIENEETKKIINYLGLGYGVHLVQDAATPMSLPIY